MRGLVPAGAGGILALVPAIAGAHAVGRAFVLLLPTAYYMAGGALAVAVSFIFLALAPGALRRFHGRVRVRFCWPAWHGGIRWLAFAGFAGLVVTGLLGPTDPAKNALPVVLWTLWWVGYTALTALAGDSWGLLNPWSAPVALLRRLGLRPVARLSPRIGYWPALAGLFGFVWFEVVSLAPADPRGLARAAFLYWLIHLGAMLAFGERRWRARGETFSVFFRLIGRIAPLRFHRRGLALGWPGARLVRAPALPVSGWLFVTSIIASVSFDGLSGTFFWLARLGINPLAFPGRSAVVVENSLGLGAAWVVLALVYAGAVMAGLWLARGRVVPTRAPGRIGMTLLPIALAYHLAHYLTALLLQGQYAAAIIARGLGLGHVHVSASFLNDMDSVTLIWQAQTALIVGGHVLAVIAAHGVALEIVGGARPAALSQLPLAVLMVGLTLLGLWLLSAPTGA